MDDPNARSITPLDEEQPRPRWADPFSGHPQEPNPLAVSEEQKQLIREVLMYSSSDSRFMQKAEQAITMILTYTGEEEEEPKQRKNRKQLAKENEEKKDFEKFKEEEK